MNETVRLFRESDREKIRAVFAKQQLNVHLPLPGEDPAVAVAVVLETPGEEPMALILRLTCEACLVVSPDATHAAHKVRRLQAHAEGALMNLSKQLRELHFGAVEDGIALVDESKPRMQELMAHLGFRPEQGAFRLYYRRAGDPLRLEKAGNPNGTLRTESR